MDQLAKQPLVKVAKSLEISFSDAQQYRTELLSESRGLLHLETVLLTLREQDLIEQINPTENNGNANDNFRDTDVAGNS